MTPIGISLMRLPHKGNSAFSVLTVVVFNAISRVGDAAGKMLSEPTGERVASADGLSKIPEDLK